jgi:hypothetical protein
LIFNICNGLNLWALWGVCDFMWWDTMWTLLICEHQKTDRTTGLKVGFTQAIMLCMILQPLVTTICKCVLPYWYSIFALALTYEHSEVNVMSCDEIWCEPIDLLAPKNDRKTGFKVAFTSTHANMQLHVYAATNNCNLQRFISY